MSSDKQSKHKSGGPSDPYMSSDNCDERCGRRPILFGTSSWEECNRKCRNLYQSISIAIQKEDLEYRNKEKGGWFSGWW